MDVSWRLMYGAMLGIAEGIAVSLRLLEVFIVLGGACLGQSCA